MLVALAESLSEGERMLKMLLPDRNGVSIIAAFALLGGCWTNTSRTPLVTDIRVNGATLEVKRCALTYEAEHRELIIPVVVVGIAFIAVLALALEVAAALAAVAVAVAVAATPRTRHTGSWSTKSGQTRAIERVDLGTPQRAQRHR